MQKMFAGHEKEPKSFHGGKGRGGKHPPMHSHSAKPHRKVMAGKGRGKRS